MKRPVAIVPAAGSGRRMGGGEPKQFRTIDGVPILLRTLRALHGSGAFARILVAVSDDARSRVEAWRDEIPGLACVAGGAERFHSVGNALDALGAAAGAGEDEGAGEAADAAGGDDRIVLVHDGVRPFVTAREIVEVVREAERTGAAIVCSRPVETVKAVGPAGGDDDGGDDGEGGEGVGDPAVRILRTIDRDLVRLAQTPQAFRLDLFCEAYRRAEEDAYVGTDESSLVERLGRPVAVVEAGRWNIKITTPEDIELAEWLLKEGKA